MADEVIYRCIDAACLRIFPRQVAFCPYCGVRQSGAPELEAKPLAAHVPSVEKALAEPVAAKPSVVPKWQKRSMHFGRKPAPIDAPAPQSTQRVPSGSPGRAPVRKRTWLMALLALVAIWLLAKPADGGKKFDARIDAAIARASECRIDEARMELAALKKIRAGSGQLQRLQNAIADTAPACERKRLRALAWSDTKNAVDAALQGSMFGKAANRLDSFVRRWDADADTRALGDRIDDSRAARQP